jgi:hypothetical protein
MGSKIKRDGQKRPARYRRRHIATYLYGDGSGRHARRNSDPRSPLNSDAHPSSRWYGVSYDGDGRMVELALDGIQLIWGVARSPRLA